MLILKRFACGFTILELLVATLLASLCFLALARSLSFLLQSEARRAEKSLLLQELSEARVMLQASGTEQSFLTSWRKRKSASRAKLQCAERSGNTPFFCRLSLSRKRPFKLVVSSELFLWPNNEQP